ncbi:MAG TPA: hypothetical protein DEF88_08425 [Porphyromonadaceae bacterium]|nr:hypothetical protein [Porphyromonadaceae bacterium]HCM21002.1 hypothetical protein [Porphyromonadaceae bacterium]
MITTKGDSIKKLRISSRNLITGGLLLALFLTICIVDTTLWRGVRMAKYFYFTVALCLSMPVLGSFIVCRKYRFFLIRTADIAVALFVFYIISHRIIMGGGNEMHWWLFLLVIPFYALVRTFAENRNGIRILTIVILITVLIETLWGILQLCGFLPSYHNAFPITGSLFNPAPYAGFVAAGIPLALGTFLSRNASCRKRILSGAVLTSSFIVLPFTGSRAAWLAAFAGGLAVVWQKYAVKRKNAHLPVFPYNRWRFIFIPVTVVLMVTLLYGMYRMKKDSADGRWLIWNVSASLVKEHPVGGIGTGRFAAAYGQAQADYFLSGRGTGAQAKVADHPDYAFNEWVHIAVELGLTGLVLFLFMIGACLFIPYTSEKVKVPTSYYLSAFIGLLVFSLFSYPFSVLPLSILFVAFLAALASQTPPLRWQPSFQGSIAVETVLFLLTVAVAFQVLPRRQSYRKWQETHILFRSGAYRDALDEYRILYPQLKYEEDFLMEYARCLSHLGKYEESNRVFSEYLAAGCDPEAYNYIGNNYKSLRQYEAAEQAYIRSCLITPNRHYPEYLLMKLYYDTGRKNKAVEKARLLMDKPVKVNSPVMELIRKETAKILETNNNINE